ncbi:MAG: right-handed parallel beta-helix repeat-containing protein [Deltaproteobacteria bacterium]|nr:right-handed parallel beta-helix repeat-containing protein [Deltaproteobacteria bacterium]
MSTITRLFLACTTASLAVAACTYEPNPNYCPGRNADNDCTQPPYDAPPGGCTSNTECSAPAPVCDVAGTKTCVQCVAPDQVDACTGANPVCGDDHACRRCAAHTECASEACLPDGSCGTEVAYVDPDGTDNAMCTQAMPCTRVSKALATGRPFVKLKGTTDEAVTVNGEEVTFLADPNAKLTRSSPGIILRVDGASRLTVHDLAISDGLGAAGTGITLIAGNTATVTLTRVKLLNNAGGGISASGGALTIAQSTISNNAGGISATGGALTVSQSTIANNAGGGISASNGATFAIVGNVFFNNGTQLGTVGGVSILTTQNAANRLEFNSFNKNQAQDTVGCAVSCLAGTFTARNNIMSGNATATNMLQVSGSCQHAYSIARPGPLPPGTGNSAEDPLFANTTTGDLHIPAGSPAMRAADPGSDLAGIAARDIDGDARTSPADIGADHRP